MTADHKYGIKTVAIQTGLTQFTIRAWEKRYDVVTPLRTETNRRLYSDADILRLTFLRLATEAGHSIGRVATLPIDELLEIVGTEGMIGQVPAIAKEVVSQETSLRLYIASCIAAVKQFEARSLESTLLGASTAFSQPVFLEKLIASLMREIGEQWRAGALRIAHEHLATAVVRTLLGNICQGFEMFTSMPNLVIATPRGQLHEIGALIAGITAAAEGWQVTYLGPNLPAEEIVGCAVQNAATAVGVSVIYPTDDPHLANELQKLRRGLQKHIPLFVGGAGAVAYDRVISAIGAVRVNDMQTFRAELQALRVQQKGLEASAGS
ncbi:MAG: MerR family transcriptional regulator [Candidatus Poribacteria bacterium]|nr:MerR family transcriptional regulator [Candidatus Poribacteria bacterium]